MSATERLSSAPGDRSDEEARDVRGRPRHPTRDGRIFNRAHGERSKDMPPLGMIQDSGIMWGFHTDTTEVNQYRPFTTLWFAATGKMIGGAVVNRQTISREEALIAHTRSNSFFVFPGKRSRFNPAWQAGGPGRDGPRLLSNPCPHRRVPADGGAVRVCDRDTNGHHG